jgi:hypothetical protein
VLSFNAFSLVTKFSYHWFSVSYIYIALQNGYIVFMSVHFVLCVDGLHLSISAQGMPNGEAALQHAAYPGMQPYPGVGMFGAAFFGAPLFSLSLSLVATTTPFGKAFCFWLRHSVVLSPLSIYLYVRSLASALLSSNVLPSNPCPIVLP